MKAIVFRCLILVATMLVEAGCEDSQPDGISVDPITPAQALIFYDETGIASPHAPMLSDVEIKRITDKTAARTSERIWLIRVKPSLSIKERGDVIVYLAPYRQTPRIREGHAYTILLESQETIASSPWVYVQVSKPDRTFTKAVGMPLVTDLPFKRPHGGDPNSRAISPMSEEEIVRIMDFVRHLSGLDISPDEDIASAETVVQETKEMPILYIGERDGKIRVEFGFQHGPLWGHGQYMVLERTVNGYIVTRCGTWIS